MSGLENLSNHTLFFQIPISINSQFEKARRKKYVIRQTMFLNRKLMSWESDARTKGTCRWATG
jgi:hypothetical protein